MITAGRVTIVAVLDKSLTVPVQVQLNSATDEPLVTYLIESDDPQKWGRILHANESRWQATDIYPVTVTATDKGGHVQEWKIDPRPRQLN